MNETTNLQIGLSKEDQARINSLKHVKVEKVTLTGWIKRRMILQLVLVQ